MAQRTDLYSILTSYANKNNSPYIAIEPFLSFLEKYARHIAEEQPEWLKWTQDTSVKFYAELAALAEDDKCELLNDTVEGRVYMPRFYLELLQQYYSTMDSNADMPFPSEETLNVEIPESQKRYLGVESSLPSYLEDPQEGDLPMIRIGFPDNYGAALIPASMIPKRLLEASMLKIRNYLRSHSNKEFALHKLTPQLMGKENNLKDYLNQILTRPLDCAVSIEEGGEFQYLFWAHFAILVKGDIKKKTDLLSEDVAAIQAIYIIEALNSYYKTLAVKRRERELALRDLEQHLNKSPYLYTLDQIIKFTSSKGVLLLSQYSNEELEKWIRKETTESQDNKLPNLLIVSGGGDRFFVSKSKIFLLCARLLAEAKEKVKKAVSKRWVRIIMEYRREPAMENDKDFDKLLITCTEKISPTLTALLEDPKLQLVYDELEQAENEIPIVARIFNHGEMLPYSSLFLLKRKDILEDAKLLLPFWYSTPILSSIIAFFRNLLKKRKKKNANAEDEENESVVRDKDGAKEMFNAAREIEFAMVPSGQSIDSYLDELKTRWSRLINKQARDNLVEDVNSLVRDTLRHTLRVHKHYKITRENLSTLALNIINRTPSLQTLSGKDPLRLYIELYLVMLLETVKF